MHTQDLACRRLLLQRFAKVAGCVFVVPAASGVLDGNDGLIRKGRNQLDPALSVKGSAGLLPSCGSTMTPTGRSLSEHGDSRGREVPSRLSALGVILVTPGRPLRSGMCVPARRPKGDPSNGDVLRSRHASGFGKGTPWSSCGHIVAYADHYRNELTLHPDALNPELSRTAQSRSLHSRCRVSKYGREDRTLSGLSPLSTSLVAVCLLGQGFA